MAWFNKICIVFALLFIQCIVASEAPLGPSGGHYLRASGGQAPLGPSGGQGPPGVEGEIVEINGVQYIVLFHGGIGIIHSPLHPRGYVFIKQHTKEIY